MRVKEMDLSTIEGVMKGSESGPVVVPGKPDESRLFQMVRDGKMPPGKTRLADDDLVSIRAWIESLSNSQSNAAAVVTETAGEHDILPVMHLRCTVCHGLRRKEGGLDLRTREATCLKGGNSGPAIVPGHPEQSLILKRIQSGDMPPKKELMDVSIKVITPAETDKLTQWIAAGAPPANIMPDVADGNPDPLVSDKDRELWSFRPPKRPAVPEVKTSRESAQSASMHSFSRKLEAKGLHLSPEADRLTLIAPGVLRFDRSSSRTGRNTSVPGGHRPAMPTRS